MDLDSFKFMTVVEIFLLSPDEKEVLLIHRSKDKDYMPDYYAGLGGKMDSFDKETPLDAAFREVKEESQYNSHEIENIELKALNTVYDRYGKWIVYDFAGKVKSKKFVDKKKIDEGVLEWVPLNKLKEKNLIYDLRDGVLEKILFTDKVLWMRAVYNKEDKLIDFKMI